MALISIILVVRSDPHLLHLTLDSLSKQEEKNFEVIVLDATGKCCIEGGEVLLQEARDAPIAEIMNQGLLLAQGTYVQFLFPGDRFLSQQATAYLEQIARDSSWPEVIYCAFLQRDPEKPPSAVALPLNLSLLRKGTMPTLPRSYWFLKSALHEIGGFDSKCSHQPSFDLLCRLFSNQKTRAVYTHRVLTDYEWKRRSTSETIGRVAETCHILYKHFGSFSALRWLFMQDHRQMIRWSWKFVKEAFIKY